MLAVSRADHLARFGSTWLERLLPRDRVEIEVLHEKGAAGGMPELWEDLMSVVATFAGGMYGIHSAELRRRLLEQANEEVRRVQAS